MHLFYMIVLNILHESRPSDFEVHCLFFFFVGQLSCILSAFVLHSGLDVFSCNHRLLFECLHLALFGNRWTGHLCLPKLRSNKPMVAPDQTAATDDPSVAASGRTARERRLAKVQEERHRAAG